MIKIRRTRLESDDLNKEVVDIFRVPMLTFKFKDHDLYADSWKKYNDEYQDYVVSSGNNVKLSLPNFHKKDEWRPLTKFFERCMIELCRDLNFGFELGITSMWSTVQNRGGHHHIHTHKNCMFIGTYYLYSDTEDTNGTTFHNVMSDFSFVKTAGYYGGHGDRTSEKMSKTSWYDNTHRVPFESGKLVMYPGWMRHSGTPHTGDNRQIIAFNAMPIGQTDKDPLQRYMYSDFRDDVMPYDDK